MSTKPKIVIVGASYAGVEVAHHLEATLGDSVDITIIDKRTHRLHVVGSLRAMIKPGFESTVAIPYDKAFKTAKWVRARATRITPTEVIIDNGPSITFDYLVIAIGSTYQDPVKMEAQAKEDLFQGYKSYQAKIKAAKSFLVLGSGPIGFEFIGELKEQYGTEKDITLVTSSDRIFPQLESKQSARALRYVKSAGANVVFNNKATSIIYDEVSQKYTVTTDKGNKYTADFVFKAYGSKPNIEPVKEAFAASLVSNRSGNLSLGVAKTLQVIKSGNGYDYETASDVYTNIYAVGDINSTPETKMAARIPGSVAVVAKNIIRQVRGKKPSVKYTPMRGELMFATFGEKGGVVQLTLPFVGAVSPNFMISMKSKDLFASKYWKAQGYEGIEAA